MCSVVFRIDLERQVAMGHDVLPKVNTAVPRICKEFSHIRDGADERLMRDADSVASPA